MLLDTGNKVVFLLPNTQLHKSNYRDTKIVFTSCGINWKVEYYVTRNLCGKQVNKIPVKTDKDEMIRF